MNRKINRLRRTRRKLLNIPLIPRFLQQTHHPLNPIFHLVLVNPLVIPQHSLYLRNILLRLFNLVHGLQDDLIPREIGKQRLSFSFYSKIHKGFLIYREKLRVEFLYSRNIAAGVPVYRLVTRPDYILRRTLLRILSKRKQILFTHQIDNKLITSKCTLITTNNHPFSIIKLTIVIYLQQQHSHLYSHIIHRELIQPANRPLQLS